MFVRCGAVLCVGLLALDAGVAPSRAHDAARRGETGQAGSPQAAVTGDVSRLLVGGSATHIVRRGDTLTGLGARFGADVSTLVSENALGSADRLAVGQPLRIVNRHIVPTALDTSDLVLNVPQRILFHGNAEGAAVGYPVAVGRADWPTPGGAFVVTAFERNPTWHVPASILEESRRQGRTQPPVVPPGPHNPLGEFWIGLSLPGIGIHGTNDPLSIYRAVSHGCIRLHPDDVAELFGRVHVGLAGRVIYEPVLFAVHGGVVYLEVHRDIYRRAADEPYATARALAAAAGVSDQVDWPAAKAVVVAREGVARDVTRPSRRDAAGLGARGGFFAVP